MELRQLRYFVAVAEKLNFSKAAQSINVTQSTISHQMKQLEYEIGYNLFDRDRHHVKLTEQGQAFLPRICSILKDLDDAVRHCRAGQEPPRDSLEIIVGASSIVSAAIPGILQRFNERFPDVSIKVEETFANQLLERFEYGGHSLAIGLEEPGDAFSRTVLCQEELVLLVPPDHALAGRKVVRMAELHRQRLALPSRTYSHRQHIDHCLERAGAIPQVIAEFENPNTMLSSLSDQTMAGISTYSLPEWLQGKGLVRVRLKEPTPMRTIVLYAKEDLSTAAELLAETISDRIREISRKRNDLGLRPYEGHAPELQPAGADR